MNTRKLLLSAALAVLITGGLGLLAFVKRCLFWDGYELGALDAAAFVLLVAVVTAFFHLKVIGRE